MFRAVQLGLRQSGAARYASSDAAAAGRVAVNQAQINGGVYDAAGTARSAYGAAPGNVQPEVVEVEGPAQPGYRSARGEAKGAMREAAGEARHAYGSVRGAAEENLDEAAGAAKSAYRSTRGSAQEAYGEAAGLAHELKNEAKGAASSWSNQAEGAASSMSSQAYGAASSATGQAKGAAASMAGQAKGAAYEAEHKVKDAAQQAKHAVTPPPLPSAPTVIGKPTIRRPIGSVRGGMMGFLLGFGIASSYGYYYLLKEYNAASNLMLASVEELQTSTDKITTHLQRLNKLESDLKTLSSGSASKSDYEKSRSEMKRIIDGLHDEVLDVKKRVIA